MEGGGTPATRESLTLTHKSFGKKMTKTGLSFSHRTEKREGKKKKREHIVSRRKGQEKRWGTLTRNIALASLALFVNSHILFHLASNRAVTSGKEAKLVLHTN